MKIAIDFDDTITLDLDKWREVISFFINRMGADVRIVTFRCEGLPRKSNPDIDVFVDSFWSDLPVIYTGGRQKAHVCAELGWNPDVWIDDNPSTIVSYSDMMGMVKGCEVNKDTGGAPVAVRREPPKAWVNTLGSSTSTSIWKSSAPSTLTANWK